MPFAAFTQGYQVLGIRVLTQRSGLEKPCFWGANLQYQPSPCRSDCVCFGLAGSKS